MRQYYERLLKNNPDVMSVEQVAQFTGYNKNSVSRWCGKKELKCFYIKQRYQIPKEYLLDFLVPDVISVFRYYFRIRKTCNKPYDFTGRAFPVDTCGNHHHYCLFVHFLLPFWAGRKEIKLL